MELQRLYTDLLQIIKSVSVCVQAGPILTTVALNWMVVWLETRSNGVVSNAWGLLKYDILRLSV